MDQMMSLVRLDGLAAAHTGGWRAIPKPRETGNQSLHDPFLQQQTRWKHYCINAGTLALLWTIRQWQDTFECNHIQLCNFLALHTALYISITVTTPDFNILQISPKFATNSDKNWHQIKKPKHYTRQCNTAKKQVHVYMMTTVFYKTAIQK